jgi:hypothetical protein
MDEPKLVEDLLYELNTEPIRLGRKKNMSARRSYSTAG